MGKYEHVTPEAARKRALKLLGEMAEGKDPSGGWKANRARVITVSEAFEAFFQARFPAPTSIPNYRRSVDMYLKDWANRPMAEISRRMVLDRHRKIGDVHGLVTANTVMRHLRSMYNFTAATNGGLPPNPVTILTQARAWNTEQRRRSIIPAHGMPRWWRAVMAEEDFVRDFLRIAILTGMRRSEIARLRWEDVDLEGRTFTVVPDKERRSAPATALELPLRTAPNPPRDAAGRDVGVFRPRGDRPPRGDEVVLRSRRDLVKVFGRNVRVMREAQGLTQEELEGMTGLPRSYISDMERGTRNPTIRALQRVAAALHVLPADLVKLPIGASRPSSEPHEPK